MKTKNTLTLVSFLFIFLYCFSPKSYSQCSAQFVDTTGSGGLVTFYSLSTGTTPPFIRDWDFGDGTNGSGSIATHTYTYNYSYTACLTFYDNGSCYDTLCRTINVTNALQDASCPGKATFTTSDNGSLTDFKNALGQWTIVNFGDGTTGHYEPSNTISHQYSLNGSYSVTAIAYTVAGSAYIACDTSAQLITVSNVPCHAAFNSYGDTSNYQIYCFDASLGAANNKWYINDTLYASNVTDFESPTLTPGTYNVCLVINGPTGCQDSACQSIFLNYNLPCPNATFTYTQVPGQCDTYRFVADTAASTITSLEWYLNSSLVSTEAVDTMTFDFSSASNIYSQYVTVITKGAACLGSQSFSFNNPANFYVDMDTSLNAHTWFAHPLFNVNVQSEYWDFGDGSSSTSAYPSHDYSTPGYYPVCHYDTLTDGCGYSYCINQYFYRGSQTGTMSHFIVVPPLGIHQQNSPGAFKVYPNPSSGILYFNFENAPQHDISLKLYSSTGMLAKSDTFKSGSTNYSLNTEGMADGIYFYEISGSKEAAIHGKIIISNN